MRSILMLSKSIFTVFLSGWHGRGCSAYEISKVSANKNNTITAQLVVISASWEMVAVDGADHGRRL